MTRCAPTLFLALVLTLSGRATAGEPAAAAGDRVTASMTLTLPTDTAGKPRAVQLGDQVVATFEIQAPADAKVFPPSPPNFGAAFKRTSKKASITRSPERAGRATEVHSWTLLVVRVGPERLPRFEVTYRLADGTSGSVMTDLIRLRVRPRLANEQDPRLGGLPATVPVVTTHWALIWGLTLLGSALLAALLTLVGIYVYRNRIIALKPKEPPLPANRAALERLDALLNSELDPAARYAAVVDVLRWYLGERYGFDGLETTTVEMRRHLGGADLGDLSVHEISQVLEETDLVKFARMTPGDGEARSKAEMVRRAVEVTWKEPDPDDTEEDMVRLEPASVRERAVAGAVDFGIAFLAGGLTATTVWRLWGGEHAWIGLVVYGLLMLLRDLGLVTSPGKLAQALLVVTRDELQTPATAGQRVGRNVLLALPLGALIEALMLLYHPLHLRIGEVWSRTEVVRRPSESLRHDSAALDGPARGPRPAVAGGAG